MVDRPLRFITSFFELVDLIAILPLRGVARLRAAFALAKVELIVFFSAHVTSNSRRSGPIGGANVLMTFLTSRTQTYASVMTDGSKVQLTTVLHYHRD